MHDRNDPLPRLLEGLAGAVLTALAGAVLGLFMALLAILAGLLRMAAALLGGARIGSEGWGDLLAYAGGFIAGGALAGLLWPLRRWVGGLYGLGVAAMGVVVFCILLVEEGLVAGWDADAWATLALLSLVFGLAAGHGLKRASFDE